jgi:hypothetical protein
MKHIATLTTALGSILTLALSLCACVALPSMGGDRWKEEVLLHDGQKIVAERYVKRGGRHEVGQKGSYVEQTLSFALPSSGKTIEWKDRLSEDLGNSSFLPMLLDIADDTPYLVAYPMGCLSYNKWGRPNPPYVVFKYAANAWQRIALTDLPLEIKTPNLIFSSPDDKVEELGQRLVKAETIQQIVSGTRQPEYKTILREPMASVQMTEMCDVLINYKGHWIDPRNPFARRYIDQKQQ